MYSHIKHRLKYSIIVLLKSNHPDTLKIMPEWHLIENSWKIN